MKKKKRSESFSESLIDAVIEIIVELLCFALGIGVICLFGAKFGSEHELSEFDSDLIVLIGVFALFLLIVAIGAVIALIKRLKRKNNSVTEKDIK